jgi:predicted negative regulator of RcsB-dependent stress response
MLLKIKQMKDFFEKYKKQVIITFAIIALNVFFGFDARFTVINLIWLIV